MTYEQKHQEDLDAAKDWLAIAKKNNNTIAIQVLEDLFPELRESEDERVRKAILHLVKSQKEQHFGIATYDDINWLDMIAWLEKQGEQNKQHLYDIIIVLWDLLDKIDTFADLQIDDTNPDNPFRKIEDITQERHKFVKSDGYNLFIENFMITNDKNFEKQGEQKIDEIQLQPKQEWSEEDEHCIELLLPIIDSSSLIPKNRKKCKEFLNSLKPHWKPSEEQMEALKNFIEAVETSNYAQLYLQWLTGLKSLYNDIKTL